MKQMTAEPLRPRRASETAFSLRARQMTDKSFRRSIDGVASGRTKTPPQPEPTSPRIKALLGKALTKPGTLTPSEVKEIAASVAYHLITQKMN